MPPAGMWADMEARTKPLSGLADIKDPDDAAMLHAMLAREAVRTACLTERNPLRASVVADPLFGRRNREHSKSWG